MKFLGYLLIAIGFVGAVVIASIDKVVINWFTFGLFVVVGIIGVALVRVATHKHAKGEDKLSNDIDVVDKSIHSLVTNMEAFGREKGTMSVYDLHKKIDELFVKDLDNFAEARESIIHIYDLQRYADLMSHFAAGERYLNRAWSASADGYIDEAHTYIDKAAEQFKVTKEHFDQLSS